jgi:hypothetical protein
MLPNADDAWIPLAKITDYLLSDAHPVGASKARFFAAHGYHRSNIKALERGLLRIAVLGRLVQSVSSPYGDKYVIDGELATPRGTTVTVRTVWIVEADARPRFVTAHPV